MNHLRIGIRLESLDLPFRKALIEASRIGVGGVQLDAVGDFAPNNLSHTGRRQLSHLLRSHDLTLTALGCPLRLGLDVPDDLEFRLAYLRDVMALSYELGCRIAIVQVGQVPENDEDPRHTCLSDALENLGSHGDRTGARLALETGLEPGTRLASFLDSFQSAGLAVNFDPANLMMNGHDVFESMQALHAWILHVHAKDARQASVNRTMQEVPLGHGDIDWMLFVATLESLGYQGWLTLERESGENRRRDIEAGVGFLRRFIG